jgi:hypothetical protein
MPIPAARALSSTVTIGAPEIWKLWTLSPHGLSVDLSAIYFTVGAARLNPFQRIE